MNTDNPSELKSFWKSHIKQWQNSGLAQAAYCKENDLIVHRFGYWKRKLIVKKRPMPDSGGFIQLKPVVVPSALTLQLPNQLRIDGITPDNVHLVKQLAELLQ